MVPTLVELSDGDEVVMDMESNVSLTRVVIEQRRVVRACLINSNLTDLEWLRSRVSEVEGQP